MSSAKTLSSPTVGTQTMTKDLAQELAQRVQRIKPSPTLRYQPAQKNCRQKVNQSST